MHLHMLMLYDMLFHNLELSLQNIVFLKFGRKIGTTDFQAMKNEF